MPKYKLLLGAAFGKKWEEDEVLRPLEQLTQAQVAAFQEYRQEVVEERSLDPLRVSGGPGSYDGRAGGGCCWWVGEEERRSVLAGVRSGWVCEERRRDVVLGG